MSYNAANPVVVQGDKSILLEVNYSRYEEARDALARFAELEKSPEHIHTYRITPLSLWNAASAGYDASFIVSARWSRSASTICRPTSGPTSSITCRATGASSWSRPTTGCC